jgi:hypothetical protein
LQRARIDVVSETIVIIVVVFISVLATVSVGIVAQRGDKVGRARWTKVDVHRRHGASPSLVDAFGIADAVVVIVHIFVSVSAPITVVIRQRS